MIAADPADQVAPDIWAVLTPVVIEQAAAKFEGRSGNGPALYRPEIVDGVAVLDVDGVIRRGAGRAAETVDVDLLAEDLAAVAHDDAVVGVFLAIDSPGGTVAGVQELAAEIRRLRRRKPVAAWTDALMTSAAYWVGSAAGVVYVSGDTTRLGSIGVLAQHRDVSRSEQRRGIRTTEIVAGRYKTAASPYRPLDQPGRAFLQGMVDHVYAVFVNEVAENRRTSARAVLANMGQGRVFLGRDAIRAGLADGVRTREQVLRELRRGVPR